jgi:hypothetical protein
MKTKYPDYVLNHIDDLREAVDWYCSVYSRNRIEVWAEIIKLLTENK